MHVLLGKRKVHNPTFAQVKKSKTCFLQEQSVFTTSRKRKIPHSECCKTELSQNNSRKSFKTENILEFHANKTVSEHLKFYSVYESLESHSWEKKQNQNIKEFSDKNALSTTFIDGDDTSVNEFSDNCYWKEILPSFEEVSFEGESSAPAKSVSTQKYNAFQYWRDAPPIEEMELQ